MDFFGEIISGAPKALKPVFWALFVVIGFTLFGGWLVQAIDTKAQAATGPLKDDVKELKDGQKALWSTVSEQLKEISMQVTQTSKDVAVLSQHVKDTDKRK